MNNADAKKSVHSSSQFRKFASPQRSRSPAGFGVSDCDSMEEERLPRFASNDNNNDLFKYIDEGREKKQSERVARSGEFQFKAM